MPDKLLWEASVTVASPSRRPFGQLRAGCGGVAPRAIGTCKFHTKRGTYGRTNLRRTQSPAIPIGKGSRNQEAQRRPDLQGRRKRRRQRLRTGPLPSHALLRTMEPPARRGRGHKEVHGRKQVAVEAQGVADRKSTRLNSSHLGISYAVFCL